MCGIVGYIGENRSAEVVLEGLTRLEYRGYDSAGICLLDSKQELQVYKKIGKIQNLKDYIIDKDTSSPMAIGHTRWATHGKVTNENAHPHNGEDIALVHNGIIENAGDLKEVLLNEGEMFASETDSEVFLVLIQKLMKNGTDFLNSVIEAFKKIRGNSAFVIMNKNTQQIICLKRSAPLVCGTSNDGKELLASSDPYALIGVAADLYFPEDEILAVLSKEQGIKFYDLDGNPSQKYQLQKQERNLASTDKGEFEHFMLKEIFEQPALMKELLEYYQNGQGKKNLENLIANVDIQRLHIVACGTAYHAGLVIREFIEKHNRLNTFVDLASEFRYRDPLLKDKDGGVFISQSGETADTLACQELCKETGLPTLSIVNVEGSTLHRNCDFNLMINAGFEIGVASTKAFTQQVLTGYFLSNAIAETLEHKKINKEIKILVSRFEELLGRANDIKEIADKLHNYKGYIFTGRGKYVPIALEGALKLKEIAYVHAEGYASGELKHGPIALIDDQMVNVAVIGPELLEKTLSNVEEVKARQGVILGIGPMNEKKVEDVCDFYIPLDFEGLNELSPLYTNLALQLFSYYVALYKGTDIDKPRNLAKSVTVE